MRAKFELDRRALFAPSFLCFSLLSSTTSASGTSLIPRQHRKTTKMTSFSLSKTQSQQTAYRRAVASARRETTKRAPGAAGGAAGSRGLSEEQKQEIR